MEWLGYNRIRNPVLKMELDKNLIIFLKPLIPVDIKPKLQLKTIEKKTR